MMSHRHPDGSTLGLLLLACACVVALTALGCGNKSEARAERSPASVQAVAAIVASGPSSVEIVEPQAAITEASNEPSTQSGVRPSNRKSPEKASPPSALAGMPGFKETVDPEADSERTGRRDVARMEYVLEGGFPSAETLAKAILESLEQSDIAALRTYAISEEDFETLLWPEFPESRPATGWTAHQAWEMFEHRNLSGSNRGLDDHAAKYLEFDSIEYRSGRDEYTNFNLHRDARIHAHTAEGESVALTFVRTLVECDGSWKIYSFTD